MVTLSALSAGWLEATVGWQTLNLVTLPILVVTMTWLTVYKMKQKHLLKSELNMGEC
jgi:hypothetical protein